MSWEFVFWVWGRLNPACQSLGPHLFYRFCITHACYSAVATKGTRCCPLFQVQHLITLVPAPEPFPVSSVKVLVAQSSPTLCGPMDWSPPNSSVHGILQTRILEWVAISFSRGSSPHRDPTWVSHIAGRFFTVWATRDVMIFFLMEDWSGLISMLKKLFSISSLLILFPSPIFSVLLSDLGWNGVQRCA